MFERLVQELSVRADRLESVMLYHDRLAKEQSGQHRDEAGTGEMDNVRRSNQAEKLRQAGLAHDAEWERVVVKVAARGRGCKSNLDAPRMILFGEARRQGHHDGLHPADLRRKRVGVNE